MVIMKIIVFAILLSAVNGAKILAFFYFPSISHQYVYRSIARELSLRGHEVTFVTTDPMKNPDLKNLTEIDISVGYNVLKRYDLSIFNREWLSIGRMKLIQDDFVENIISAQMKLADVQNLLKQPETTYDLILIEPLLPFFYGLQYKFKAPLITVTSFPALYPIHDSVGNPTHPVLYPIVFSGLRSPFSSIWSKLESVYCTFSAALVYRFHSLPTFDKLARSFFGNDMPHLEEFIKNTSLAFANTNPIFSDRRPHAPNFMEVWNMHLDRKEPLSSDLQKLLDEAKNGVVYLSFGTNVRFHHVQGDMKRTILDALGELPYTVLCKWESDDYPGKPKNVVLRKWFPQQTILAHKNVKVFVTQGGLQSSEEAIIKGVPLVVVPFLGDQPTNAEILSKYGMAEAIPSKYLNKQNLRDSILKVAKDERYRLKAQELRSIFLDQPQTGIEKIVWWCEYVIRHKGAKHLRSPGADIPLYEYFMLDIFAVILAAIFVIYKLSAIILSYIIGFSGKSETKIKTKVN